PPGGLPDGLLGSHGLGDSRRGDGVPAWSAGDSPRRRERRRGARRRRHGAGRGDGASHGRRGGATAPRLARGRGGRAVRRRPGPVAVGGAAPGALARHRSWTGPRLGSDAVSKVEPPVRVAFLIDTLRLAGAEKQLVTVATGVDRRRFVPWVVCLTDTGAYESTLREAGVPVTLIGKRHKIGGLAFRRLRELLRRERPHVLHTWMFTCNLYGRLAARGLPIATLASEVAADVTKSGPRLAIDRLLAHRTDAVYVNSSVVARFYHERCGIPLEKLVIIPNGVRVTEMAPASRAALSIPEDAFIVC